MSAQDYQEIELPDERGAHAQQADLGRGLHDSNSSRMIDEMKFASSQTVELPDLNIDQTRGKGTFAGNVAEALNDGINLRKLSELLTGEKPSEIGGGKSPGIGAGEKPPVIRVPEKPSGIGAGETPPVIRGQEKPPAIGASDTPTVLGGKRKLPAEIQAVVRKTIGLYDTIAVDLEKKSSAIERKLEELGALISNPRIPGAGSFSPHDPLRPVQRNDGAVIILKPGDSVLADTKEKPLNRTKPEEIDEKRAEDSPHKEKFKEEKEAAWIKYLRVSKKVDCQMVSSM